MRAKKDAHQRAFLLFPFFERDGAGRLGFGVVVYQ